MSPHAFGEREFTRGLDGERAAGVLVVEPDGFGKNHAIETAADESVVGVAAIDFFCPGDIERAVIEWRSLLRHIVWAPAYDWPRWRELKAAAAQHIEDTPSPTLLALPPLTAAQQRR